MHVLKFMTFEPGDVTATGTPEGIRPIIAGDVVEIEIVDQVLKAAKKGHE